MKELMPIILLIHGAKKRSDFGTFPRFGCPLWFWMAICALPTVIFIGLQGYIRILISFTSNIWNRFKSSFQMVFLLVENVLSNLLKLLKCFPIFLWNIIYFISFHSAFSFTTFILWPFKIKTLFVQAIRTKDPTNIIPQVYNTTVDDDFFFKRKYLMLMPKLLSWITQQIVLSAVIIKIFILLPMSN